MVLTERWARKLLVTWSIIGHVLHVVVDLVCMLTFYWEVSFLKMLWSNCPSLKERIVRSSTPIPDFSSQLVGIPDRYKRYTDEQLEKAYKCATQGELSIHRAAEAFDIPRSTLYDKISGKSGFGCTSGPPRYLSDSEEGELVNFLVGCSKVGYPRSRKV